MPLLAPFVAWSSATILLALAVRALAAVWADFAAARRGRVCACGRNGRAGELSHAAMAAGMAVSLLPLRAPVALLVALFAVGAVLPVGVLFTWQRARPAAYGSAAHHVALSLVMIWMLVRPSTGGARMAGMTMGQVPTVPGMLALAYVWLAVLVLGVGLTRATAAPSGAPAASALASRPLGHACELVMTLLMGIILLA